jgi:coenzyme F420-0:L-glutamate ligase / coenzyme F420-1:gamma-L-glutamate ligase
VSSITATALAGIPEITPGDDLAGLIATAAQPHQLTNEDVLVIAHKVVSKAEGRLRSLAEVTPGRQASTLAAQHGKDPRHVQVVLDESRRILRASHGVLICETHHGFICANAGVDASNVPGEDVLVMLPLHPDASARALRSALYERLAVRPAVLITDSFGRAWRHGQCDVAIGGAGIALLQDWRGRVDTQGRELKATWIAVADELAAAADLARSKDASEPVVLVRGAGRHVTEHDGPGAGVLIRPEAEDLFR